MRRSRKFNPAQPRDDDGKWTGTGGTIAEAVVSTADGDVSVAKLGNGRMRLSFEHAGPDGIRQQTSTTLDERAVDRAANMLDMSDDSLAIGKTTSIGDVDGDNNLVGVVVVHRTGPDAYGVELLDTEGTRTMTRAEMRRLAAQMARLSLAGRADTDAGPMDVVAESGQRFTVKLPATTGAPIMLDLSRKEGDALRSAVNDTFDDIDFAEGAEAGDVVGRRTVQTPTSQITVTGYGDGTMAFESSAHDWYLRLPMDQAGDLGPLLHAAIDGADNIGLRTVRPRQRFDPSQPRDEDGRWVGGAPSWDDPSNAVGPDEWESVYGTVDEYAWADGEGYATLGTDGDIVISMEASGDDRVVLADGVSSDEARALAEMIDTMVAASDADDGPRDADDATGLVDVIEGDGWLVGYDAAGDIRIGRGDSEDGFNEADIGADSATDLAGFLHTLADAADEYNEADDAPERAGGATTRRRARKRRTTVGDRAKVAPPPSRRDTRVSTVRRQRSRPAAPRVHWGRAFTERSVADQPAGTPIPFTASTQGIQRDGLDLRASGWRLDNFSRNPVFLWNHDYTAEPLGRVAPAATGTVLRAEVVFDQEDERARRIESKYRRGFLSAVSVGWDFVDQHGQRMNAWTLSADQMRDAAFYDLLELSAVPVPADPNALVARQRTALRRLSRDLVSLFDEQERIDSPVPASDIHAAVRAELTRMGLPVPTTTVSPPPAAGIDETAARTILAAFDLKESHA
jgi:hypothetical protein